MAVVLLVSTGDAGLQKWRSALEKAGHTVVQATTGNLLDVAREQSVEIVVIDVTPLQHGVHLVGIMELRRRFPAIGIVALCGGRDAASLLGIAAQAGADITLRKPFSCDRLVQAVAQCLQKRGKP